MIRRLNPGTVLAVIAALLVMRIPLSFILLLVVPWVMVIGGVLRRGRIHCAPLAIFLGWCLAASAVSVLALHPNSLLSTGNNAAIMLAVIGFTLVVFRSAEPGRIARRGLEGLYWGAVGLWAMAIGEIATGVKLLPILYPGANTVMNVQTSRLVTSATYPNINDFCVVMAMLFTGVLAKMWFAPVKGWQNRGRWLILLSTLLLVVVMGSRGALLGCLGGFFLLVLLNIRRLHRTALGWRAAIQGGILILVGGVALLASPYIQDHSTAKRGIILSNAMTMMSGSPGDAFFGYGSLVDYQNAARAAYGDMLMDPHNLLLEICLRYGVIALVLFVALWLWVLVRGFLPRRPMVDWQTAFGLTVVVLLPVLGVVPSSMLRYHVTWIYLAATCLLVAEARRSSGSATAADEVLGQTHHDDTRDDTDDDSHQRGADCRTESASAGGVGTGARR